jgi:hypothetical protein
MVRAEVRFLRRVRNPKPNAMPQNEIKTTINPRVNANEIFSVIYGSDFDKLMNEAINEEIVSACCSFNCKVKPDGFCRHGCPSIFVAIGLI